MKCVIETFHIISHDIAHVDCKTLQNNGQEPLESQLLTQGECLTQPGCFAPMANMNPHKVQ